MITGEIKNKIDQLWNAFWSGGVSNPLSVIEQITYLLFAKRLDDIHTNKLNQANLLGEQVEEPIFEAGQENLRWSRFKDFEPELLHENKGKVVSRNQLYDHCWGRNYLPSSRSLDQHISQLRKRIEINPAVPVIVATVHGAGYRFDP